MELPPFPTPKTSPSRTPNTPPLDQRGPLDDPDSDGISNLLEYALGGDPMQPDQSILPVGSLIENEQGSTFHFTYMRARADITYTVVASASLEQGSWSEDGVEPGTGVVGEYVTASIPINEDQPRVFLRLEVAESD